MNQLTFFVLEIIYAFIIAKYLDLFLGKFKYNNIIKYISIIIFGILNFIKFNMVNYIFLNTLLSILLVFIYTICYEVSNLKRVVSSILIVGIMGAFEAFSYVLLNILNIRTTELSLSVTMIQHIIILLFLYRNNIDLNFNLNILITIALLVFPVLSLTDIILSLFYGQDINFIRINILNWIQQEKMR